ncbi:MAG: cyclic nucleotide-gated ion channel [Rhizobiaceae bacterium]
MVTRSPVALDRRRLFDILERTQQGDLTTRLVDVVIVSLIVLLVVTSVLETVPWIITDHAVLLGSIDQICITVFTIEYLARIWTAPEHPLLRGRPAWHARLSHACSPLMVADFLALSPVFLHWLLDAEHSVLHAMFMFRFCRLTRYVSVLATITDVIVAEWRKLAGSALLFVALLLFSGFAMHLAEGDIQPSLLGNVPQAIWWAIVTLSTVGYGDVVPVTVTGRIIAGLTMVLGLVFFALPVGIISSSFQEKLRRRDFVVGFAMVAKVPLFANLDLASVSKLVDLLKARRVSAGQTIFNQGDEARSMYFVNSGKVEIDRRECSVTLQEGDFFGEMALISQNKKRNATVTARCRSDLLELSAQDFQKLILDNPQLGKVVHEVAQRRSNAEPAE